MLFVPGIHAAVATPPTRTGCWRASPVLRWMGPMHDGVVLVYGADGEWRRLDLGELGLEDAAIYQDTYGAGRLSPDGRWWMGPTHDGVVLVDLSTGEARQQPVRVGGVAEAAWIPGTNSIAVNGVRIDLATGKVRRTPYRFAGEVGFEPDGTPVFVDAGRDGEAILYEWREGEKVVRVHFLRYNRLRAEDRPWGSAPLRALWQFPSMEQSWWTPALVQLSGNCGTQGAR
jgi:hypothetical protein